MKSIHFMLDFHQLFEFTGCSHLLEILRNPRHSPLGVVCFNYIEKKKKKAHTQQTSACFRAHLHENDTRLPTNKPYRAHIDHSFAG